MSHQPVMMAYDAASFAPDGRRLWYSSDFDTIDRLDTSGPNGMPMFHHGGPYDAVLPSRNWDPKTSPMAALSGSLAEALRATPQEYIADCLQQGVPLQGTATIPSGQLDYEGNRMDYEEGSNLVRDSDSIAVSYQQYRQWDCGSVVITRPYTPLCVRIKNRLRRYRNNVGAMFKAKSRSTTTLPSVSVM